MINITETLEGPRRVFRIEGRLTDQDVPALEKKCAEVGGPHVLDLSGLRSADNVGSEKLRACASNGVEIRGASPYVQLLIDGGS